jgi:hypothetical protein
VALDWAPGWAERDPGRATGARVPVAAAAEWEQAERELGMESRMRALG